jgi:hypothetical protein
MATNNWDSYTLVKLYPAVNRPSTRDNGPVPPRRSPAKFGLRELVAEIQANRRSLETIRIPVEEGRELSRRVDLKKLRRFILSFGEVNVNDLVFCVALVEHPLGDHCATLEIVVELHRISADRVRCS